ncbi:MAG: hypothetical protein V1703_03270 [Candidatus Altiarchaeota archaeon]
MKRSSAILLVILLLLLTATTVLAQKESFFDVFFSMITGFIDKIMITLGVGTPTTTTVQTTTTQFFCPKPYLEYKTGECCLDANGNNICDKDESTTQQSQSTQATTVGPSYGTTTTTQTQQTQQTTSAAQTTTQQGQTTLAVQRCGQGYYDDSNCGVGCPSGQICSSAGRSVNYQGQTINCYACRDACPTNDPDYIYYYKDPTCKNLCNKTGGWDCFKSTTHNDCYFCAKPCPNTHYYNDSTCKNQCSTGSECTKSTAYQYPCYWCRSPCPEGYYYKDPNCGYDCEKNEQCNKTTDDCYLCVSRCPVGYYYKDDKCGERCEQGKVCGQLTGYPDCYYCRGSTTTTQATTTRTTTTTPATSTQATTTRATTTQATTTTRATTTTIVVCGGSLFNSNNCDGQCNQACEVCSQYQGTPCYYCQKDCTRIGSGWGTSSVCSGCDSQHEECVQHSTCSGCYHCVETCPENLGYYRFQGCDAQCDSRLCAKVGGSGQYKDCYQCNQPRCGDGIISPPGEECEQDSDCPDYHYCDVDCLCTTDCAGYCADQGANGYTLIGGIGTKAKCEDKMNADMDAKRANCRAVCGAYAWLSGMSTDCCCVDTDWKPCLNCPNQDPARIDCDTPLAQCKAGL